MRVDFDTQIFAAQEFGGISRYFASIAAAMHEHRYADARIVAPLHINAYLAKLPGEIVVGRKIGRPARAGMLVRAASMALSVPLHWARRPDIVHETYYSPIAFPARARQRVVTVYDMIHEIYPADFSPHDPIRAWKRAAIQRADHIICISECTRRDLLAMHDIPPERVSVTYLGYDKMVPADADSDGAAFRARAGAAGTPYILYVGHRAGYKNFDGLLQAYAASSWLRANFRLLCFGGGPFSAAERERIAGLGVAGRVSQIGGGDEVLTDCYRYAAIFVYPSCYEGFGIPPLEAMSLDCPVACSNTSSIPEVVADAAAGFDPADPDAIRQTLERVLNSPAVCDDLVRRGRARCEMFSWQRCAQETVGIYRRVLG